MHSSTCDLEPPRLGGAEVFVAIAALVTEGRTPSSKTPPSSSMAAPDKPGAPGKHRATGTTGFSEGPHCTFSKASQGHVCNLDNLLCIKYDKIRSYVLSLWQKSLPLCIDVLLVPNCCCENDLVCNPCTSQEPIGFAMLLEQWNINVLQKRSHDFAPNLNINQLISAIRSQLYFSQISAWLASPDEKIRSSFQDKAIVYCLTVPGETFGCKTFTSNAQHHNFPTADLGNGLVVKVSLSNVPRTAEIPHIKCSKCDAPPSATGAPLEPHISVLDDRMQMSCTLKGKHRCDDYDEFENNCNHHKRNYLNLKNIASASTSTSTSTSNSTTSVNGRGGQHGNNQGTSKTKLHGGGGKCDNGASAKVDLELSRKELVEVLSVLKSHKPKKKHDLANRNQGDILLDAILRSSNKVVQAPDVEEVAVTVATVATAEPMQTIMPNKRKGATFMKTLFPTPTATMLDDVDDDTAITTSTSSSSSSGVNNECGGCSSTSSSTSSCGGESMLRVSDNNMCDNKNDSIITSDNRSLGGIDNIYIDINCDNIKRKKTTDYIKMCDISNVFSLEYLQKRQKVKVKQKITFDDNNHYSTTTTTTTASKLNDADINKQQQHEQEQNINTNVNLNGNNNTNNNNNSNNNSSGIIPSALEQAKFRKSLDNAASMVFHSRTGLPLTSSPAPVRRGKSCFDFDSSINSVSAIRSALFSLASCSTDEDSESDCSIVSPCSPETTNGLKQREIPLSSYRHRGQSSGLLGSFVESVLNGRLEPVSTVHGFSAELGASGSFCPRHVVLPVTVFFYTLGDNDKVSTPYLGHINLGKKGYNVPKSGTIQVTLFNPLGTVVKMFVIMYDLSDMPPNSQTFIRQRTLFMPANCQDKNLEWSQKWLRYLIHLRFMSSKSGRIYLHSDIRMIICRKSDLDTATAHGIDMSYELRSFINSPTNPRFSPRK